jgi:PAS domain S-box-containing protein
VPSRRAEPPWGSRTALSSSEARVEGRVLVVDDTESKRYLISQSLRMAGMEVVEACDGREALAAVVGQPDVVLLDVRLPDMSGFEVCHRLKTDPTTAAIPVLYVSALMQDAELEARLFEDGADGYVPQPIEPKHLVAQTWALVRMRRAELSRTRERHEARRQREQLLGELESSEGRLRLALGAAELGAWSYEVATRTPHCDARVRELLGLTPEQPVTPVQLLERMHPEDRELVREAARRGLRAQGDGDFRLEGRVWGGVDGVVRWLSVHGRVRLDAAGRPESIAGICQDITERKLGERRAAAFQATTAAFAHALTPREVCRALLDHGLESMDAFAGSVCLMEGETPRLVEHVGYEVDIDWPFFLRAPDMPFASVVRTGRAVHIPNLEALARDWPGFAPWVRDERSRAWLGLPLSDGTRQEGLLWLSFGTSRRLGVAEMAHLESLCQLATQALARARLYEEERQAKEEARRREALEQQFLGMVSHDLRNPLQAISLGARALQRMERPSPEAVLRLSGRIAVSADRMGHMVSDLLDFTRGRLGGGIPLEPEPGELVRLCREVLDEFSLSHPDGELVLEGDAECEGTWDGPRMRQVLCNLVGNALRHARPGTPVRLRVWQRPDEAVVEVHNEGEPVPSSLLPVLFEPFRRGSTQFRPAGSLGLGLYIVRQVVDSHGGRVEVRTGEAGTTFTVRVPRGADFPPGRSPR